MLLAGGEGCPPLGQAQAMIDPSEGCGMQRAGSGAIHRRAHAAGRSCAPLPRGRNGIHPPGWRPGLCSAWRQRWGAPVAPPLPLQGFLAQLGHVAGRASRAGLVASAAPHPGVGAPRPLLTKAPRNIFNQCKIGADGAGRAMGGACSSHGRAALCVGASGAPGPALPAIEVTDEWDVPDAPHSSGRPSGAA